ncbi:hypothetical protein D9611_005998 [Ephemerocybe angulata]|uniref:F-box domain-containing protein n=1 Tax=Ephemerocybe angulata TaxID=980116 RepID=A0A8H5CHB1_9AGAR|nr:hypothetical protein D9611_005998 [Tulosesus angulatus]
MRRSSTAQRHVHAHASSSLYTPSPNNPSSSTLPPYPQPISSSTSTSSTTSSTTTTNNNTSTMPAPPINTIYIPTIPPPTPAPSPGPPSPPFFLDSAPASPPHTPSSTASSLPSPTSPGASVGSGVGAGLGFDLSGVDLASLPPEVLSLLASAPNSNASTYNAGVSNNYNNTNNTTATSTTTTPPIRRTLLTALLSTCTPAELLFISTLIAPRLKRDFLSTLPAELSLHILSFIDDPRTLARAGRVCRRWGVLCAEEGVWRGMCGRWGYGVPRGRGRGLSEGKGGREGVGEGEGEEGEGGFREGCGGYGEGRREEPLEEMEAYANFPMDPALEWLITKRREELAPEGKGKGKGRDVRERDRASACARARYKVFHSPPSSIIDPDAQQDRDYDYGGLTTTGARRRLPHLRLFPTRTPAS